MMSRIHRSLLCLSTMLPLCAVAPDATEQGQQAPHFQNLKLKSEYLQRMLAKETPEKIEKAAAIKKMESMQVSYAYPLVMAALVHAFVGTIAAGMTHGTDKDWGKWFGIFLPIGAIFSVPTALFGILCAAGVDSVNNDVREASFEEDRKEFMSKCEGEQCQEFVDLVMRGERKASWIKLQDSNSIYKPEQAYKTWSAKYDDLHK